MINRDYSWSRLEQITNEKFQLLPALVLIWTLPFYHLAFHHCSQVGWTQSPFSAPTWSLSSRLLGSELNLRRALRSKLWDDRSGGGGARLFFGVSTGLVGAPSEGECVLGKAMLSGRGLLTSTGEDGALAVFAFKEQTFNQDLIRRLFPNSRVHVGQLQTWVKKPPSDCLGFKYTSAVENQCVKTQLYYNIYKYLYIFIPALSFSCFF